MVARSTLPAAVLIMVVMYANSPKFGVIHGQTPLEATQSEKLGTVEGEIKGIQRAVDSMPEQLAVTRERLIRVESKVDMMQGKVDDLIARLDWWTYGLRALLVGVFGNLVNEIYKRWNSKRLEETRIETVSILPYKPPVG